MFETPILFVVFNRPDTTQQTFNALKKVKPKQLFVSADGPRPNVSTDADRCRATRHIIETQIDWPCDLHTLFRTENRGCGYGPAEAISWFFDHVEAGIVLEDDCLPELSFFSFCQQLLIHYAADERVTMITGTNALKRWFPARHAYLFSYLGHSLGWATWRRAWQAFDYDLVGADSDQTQQRLQVTLQNNRYVDHYLDHFRQYQKTKPTDVWDFQWLFARWMNGGCTIVPTVNLVSNIGFHADATHSTYENDPLARLPLYPIRFPLKHTDPKIDRLFDWVLFERFVNPQKRVLWKKIFLKGIRWLAT